MTNPTPTRGVPVELDRERRLRYSLKTMREMRRALGEAPTVGTDILCKVLWYGLKHEDPTLTEDAIEEMVDLENLPDVVRAVRKASGIQLSYPGVPPEPATPAPNVAGEIPEKPSGEVTASS